MCEKRRNKESIKAGSIGNTAEEKERMVERQSGREPWESKGESNVRTSRWKETQRQTKEEMEGQVLKHVARIVPYLTIMQRISVCVFVCCLIKSVLCRESAQDTPCQLWDWAGMLLEVCRSLSCLAAEQQYSFVHSPWAKTPFLKLLTLPLQVIGGLYAHHAS